MSKSTLNSSPPSADQAHDTPPPILDEGLIKHFLENQSKQLELQALEAKFREKQMEQDHAIAVQSLHIQNQNEDRLGKNKLVSQKQQYYFWGVIVVTFFVVLTITICLNKESVALEILKVVVPAILSAIGSYFYGVSQGEKKGKKSKYESYEEIEPEE
ncbi:hypothetical protein L3C95_31165 [Chitinophaga filiformis]|uniref:hypothetical protein n=1 Tax=Chitinophaga filiformis TaxID=104663 RepID=UPI001F3F2025|nr:hypothetical protein [Chitinophaga filiformis]MCF6407396.1 hypothetical protein [Chitinophaga filiformis]